MHDIQGDTNLSRTLNNTFTFTATQTWTRFHADKTVFVDTGDIQQMWLRDSSNQMRVYLPLAKTSAAVAAVFVGVLKRYNPTLLTLFSRPFFARFAPFFHRCFAVSGFLAPRRRGRANNGVKWAKSWGETAEKRR